MTTILLDTSEAAHRLRLAPRTLQKWRVQGRGPTYRKHGARVYYSEEDLEIWSKTQTHGTASGAMYLDSLEGYHE